MSRVFILFEGKFSVHDAEISKVVGVVSKESSANQWWSNNKDNQFYRSYELDDPELLNRIAKENKNE